MGRPHPEFRRQLSPQDLGSAPPLLWLCVHGVWQGLAPPPWVQGRRRGRKAERRAGPQPGHWFPQHQPCNWANSAVFASGPLFPFFVCITPDWNACCCLCVVLNQSSVMTNMNVFLMDVFQGPLVASIKG